MSLVRYDWSITANCHSSDVIGRHKITHLNTVRTTALDSSISIQPLKQSIRDGRVRLSDEVCEE